MQAEADKHVDEALRSYARATDLQPDALEPLEAEVRLLLSLKRTAVAEKRLDDIAARAPTAPFAPNLKGELLFAENDLPGAQAQYKIAMQRAPTWWLPYHNLAQAQFAAKDPDGALATLHTAQKVTGAPERIGVDIAYFDERSGKFDDAIREYENVLRSAPQSEVAANNLAMALVTYKRDAASLDRAKALTARFADSSNPNYLDTYGWVLFKHGEAAASVSVLERVVSKAPDAPVALYHLGMAQSQAGSTAQALGNLTKAVNSGAKFSGLDEARAALERLAKLPTDSAAKT
jgi:tetratricopeptide (TPR) repeat protein